LAIDGNLLIRVSHSNQNSERSPQRRSHFYEISVTMVTLQWRKSGTTATRRYIWIFTTRIYRKSFEFVQYSNWSSLLHPSIKIKSSAGHCHTFFLEISYKWTDMRSSCIFYKKKINVVQRGFWWLCWSE
jgi:hypothetical protein